MNSEVEEEQSLKGPEIFLGVVGALGTDLALVEKALQAALAEVDYKPIQIRLSDLLMKVVGADEDLPSDPTALAGRKMDAGNAFRVRAKRTDAVALLAIVEIVNERKKRSKEGKPVERGAYILRQLKTPEEVHVLRKVYGKNFYLIAAYCPKKQRLQNLSRKNAALRHEPESRKFEPQALDLMLRDEVEHGNEYGQNVRATFPLADYFLNTATVPEIEAGTKRFIELLFGHPVRTPTKDESSMFQAFGAALRSSAGRQVGAAIATADGQILSVGTNEVAKAFGGQYWDGDGSDGRDYTRFPDSTGAMVDSILADLIARLKKANWLAPAHGEKSTEQILEAWKKDLLEPFRELDKDAPPSLRERALIKNLIEYLRPVHAEMAAICASSRRGIATENASLYSSTFPCHECARNIVAAGIREVIFIEPYPKSRVEEMFDDSIVVDDSDKSSHVIFRAFTGVAPRKYVEFFSAPERDHNGKWIEWEEVKRRRSPRNATEVWYTAGEPEYVRLAELSINQPKKENGNAPKG